MKGELFSEYRHRVAHGAVVGARRRDALGAAMFFTKGAEWIGDFSSAREMNLHALSLRPRRRFPIGARPDLPVGAHVMGGESQTRSGRGDVRGGCIVYNALR